MARRTFDANLKDIEKFKRFAKNAPKRFASATGMMLNNMAFGTREESIDVINNTMIVRNKRFVETRMRVQKARGRLPISGQIALVGSIGAKRFTAWEEQQLRKPTKRKRTFTKAARGGRATGTIRRRFRADRKVLEPSDVQSDMTGSRTRRGEELAFLSHIRRNRIKDPFILRRLPTRSGVFYFKGKKLLRLYTFRTQQPRKIPWMETAINRYTRKVPPEKLWNDALKRVLEFR